MDEKIIVALIAAGASLVVSVITLIGNRRVAKRSVEADSKLSKLKLEYERKGKGFELSVADASPVEEACDEFWSVLQSMKDEISSLSEGQRQNENNPLHRFNDSVQLVLDTYTKIGGLLDSEVLGAAHGAKTMAGRIRNRFEFNKELRNPNTHLSVVQSDSFQDYASFVYKDITQYQMQIKTFRMELRQKKLEKILENLNPEKDGA